VGEEVFTDLIGAGRKLQTQNNIARNWDEWKIGKLYEGHKAGEKRNYSVELVNFGEQENNNGREICCII
jgi:hypothetical protein